MEGTKKLGSQAGARWSSTESILHLVWGKRRWILLQWKNRNHVRDIGGGIDGVEGELDVFASSGAWHYYYYAKIGHFVRLCHIRTMNEGDGPIKKPADGESWSGPSKHTQQNGGDHWFSSLSDPGSPTGHFPPRSRIAYTGSRGKMARPFVGSQAAELLGIVKTDLQVLESLLRTRKRLLQPRGARSQDKTKVLQK